MMTQAHPHLLDTAVRPLARLLTGNRRWRDHELFGWLLDDVLADLTGRRKPYPPPVEAIPCIRELAATYAQCVIQAAPFTDLLGPLYMETAWQSTRRDRGLFFTPQPVAALLARMTLPDTVEPNTQGRLWRVCEPAAGSGVLLLAMAQAISDRFGPAHLQHWGFTAVDRMADCAPMTAVQLLANGFVHQYALGELLVFQGNALGAADDWQVIIHATAPTLPPETVAPANHPARLEAIKAAARAAGLDLFCLPVEEQDEAA